MFDVRNGSVLVLIAAVAVLAASATAARAPDAATTVKIGWISGLTGTQATNSVAATQGMAAALKVINTTQRGRGKSAPDGDEGRRRDAPGRKPAVQRARQPRITSTL